MGSLRSIRYIIIAESDGERILTRNSAIIDKPRDAFRGQSRSPNMVRKFQMLGMVSYYCAIVTFSVKRTVFEIFDFKNARTLKIG